MSRAGITTKVSLSIRNDDLAVLRRRASREHHGNLSAVIADLVAEARRQEAWEKMLAWYGKPVDLSDAEREAIHRDLSGGTRRKVRRRRAA